MRAKTKTTRSKLKSLAEVSSLINSSLDIQTVLDNSMKCVQSFMNAEASAIFELNGSGEELYFRTALGDTAENLKGVRIKIGEGIAGLAAQTGEAVIVPDAQNDPRVARKVDSRTGFKTRSILCAPMRSKGRIVGVLEVLNKKGGKPFTGLDLEMLEILGNLIAVALDNAGLYSRLNEKFVLTEEELKVTQARLIRSERLAALGKLSAGVAHEVRNPVMVIGGFARRLRKQFTDLEPVCKCAEVILSEAERLQEMVADIEAFCALPSPTLRAVAVDKLVERLLPAMADEFRTQGVRVKVKIEGTAGDLQADERLLETALRNIVKNAVEAMPDGGDLELTLDYRPDALSISVKDHGVGIRPKDLPNIFDPFFTSKTRGSGLGLTAAHRIVSDHGGEIAVTSAVGQGAEVRVILPRVGGPVK